MNELIGKVIKKITINLDHTIICFETDQGHFAYVAEGGCCSRSWISNLTYGNRYSSSPIKEVKEISMPEVGVKGTECLQQYGIKLIDKDGYEILIEHRNESNGYYGGSMVYHSSIGPQGLIVEDDF